MTKIKAENIKLVPVDSIIANPKNTNKHSQDQIDSLCKLIKHNGFRDPLIISNRSGFLICGHARLEAAKELEMSSVPVIYQDFKDEAEEFQFMTAHNAISRWSEFDNDLILEGIKDFEIDLDLMALKDFNLAPMEIEEEDELEENEDKKWILEITFPNEMELRDIHDDLTTRGYIVKDKSK
mgnify:CR=1 FL=1